MFTFASRLFEGMQRSARRGGLGRTATGSWEPHLNWRLASNVNALLEDVRDTTGISHDDLADKFRCVGRSQVGVRGGLTACHRFTWWVVQL